MKRKPKCKRSNTPIFPNMKEIPIHCSYDKLVPRREMLPHELNPNTHPPEQIALFAKILESTGLRRPFRVSKLSGKITAGHGALLACDLLKIDLLPVDFQDYEDEREEMMDLAADNRLAEFAETDDDALAELARQLLAANELAESPVDLGVSGYSAEFLEDLASNLIGEEEEGGEKDPPDPKPL